MSAEAQPNRFAAKVKQAEPANVKQLRIKVGSVKRTTKDLHAAVEEVKRENARLETFRESDPDKIPQQEKVIREAEMMVPHSQNRIRSMVADLRDYLDKERANIEDEELIQAAESALTEAETALQGQ